MKYITAKSASDIRLKGIVVEFEIADGRTKSATLTDEDGNVVKFTQESYSNFCVYVPEPPKKVTKYRLAGEVMGLPVDEIFEQEHEAMHRRNQLASAMHNEPELTIEQVEVEVPA